jgi:nitrite reductase (NO-forming)
MAGSYEKMQAMRPDEVVFNGAAFQYAAHPLTAKPGDLIRLYVVNAGPSLWSAFHVIGAIFDRVYPGGDPKQAIKGVSTYTVGPGEGAVFDVTLDEAGEYPFVDHAMAHAVLGAQGILMVTKPGEALAAPPISKAPVDTLAVVAPPAATTGPYKFDAARAATLYASKCAACHQATGMGLAGVFPPLKGNPSVLDADPIKHIRAILHGLQGEAIGGVTYASAMPPFADALNDADVADIANHERTSWGNQGKLVTAEQIKAVRAASK